MGARVGLDVSGKIKVPIERGTVGCLLFAEWVYGRKRCRHTVLTAQVAVLGVCIARMLTASKTKDFLCFILRRYHCLRLYSVCVRIIDGW